MRQKDRDLARRRRRREKVLKKRRRLAREAKGKAVRTEETSS